MTSTKNEDLPILLSQDEKEAVSNRIHRVIGQLNAIENMINQGGDFNQLLIQVQAVTSAIDSMKIELVQYRVKSKISEELANVMKVLK